MKSSLRTLSILLALGSAAPAATALACPDGHGHGGGGRGHMFEKFDQDGDGKILLKDLPDRAKEHLWKADTNGDGVLTKAEFEAAKANFKKAHFDKMDTNHDGSLTVAEVGTAHWSRVSQADTNKDSKVTQAELEAAWKKGPPPGR